MFKIGDIFSAEDPVWNQEGFFSKASKEFGLVTEQIPGSVYLHWKSCHRMVRYVLVFPTQCETLSRIPV